MRKPYRVHQFGHSLVVCIPVKALQQLKWRKGTEVFIDVIDGRAVITDADRKTRELFEIRVREGLERAARKVPA